MNFKSVAAHPDNVMGPRNNLPRNDTLVSPEYWATARNPAKAKREWLGVHNAHSACPSATISAKFRAEFKIGPSPKSPKKKKPSAAVPVRKVVKKVVKKGSQKKSVRG